MSASRLAPLPVDHLDAELSAYPVASEAALRLAPIRLDPRLSSERTGDLWREAEKDLLGCWPAVSLDECIALRDRLWFRNELEPTPVPMALYLRRLARQALHRHGTLAVPAMPGDDAQGAVEDHECRARSAWRWLSLALPPDLLLAALGQDSQPPHAVDTLTPGVTRLLADRGFAELHLHFAAAMDFPAFWVGTLRALTHPEAHRHAFRSPGACLDEGRDLAPWLLRTAITRYVLAAFLQDRGTDDWRDYLETKAKPLYGALGATGAALLVTSMDDLARGRLAAPGSTHAAFQSLYRQLIRPLEEFPQEPGEVGSADPIAPLVPWSRHGGAAPEVGFVARGLAYVEDSPEDRPFATLFWQVIRVRCLLYRHVVQRPLTPGLQWFLRTFDRMRPGRRLFGTKFKARSAAALCGRGSGLRSLEMRTAPDSSLSRMVGLVRDLDASFDPAAAMERLPGSGKRWSVVAVTERDRLAYRTSELWRVVERAAKARYGPGLPQDSFEMGLVLHLPRDRGGGWSEGRPTAYWQGSHADPYYDVKRPRTGNPSGFRYARFYRQSRREARGLVRLLTSFPASLRIVRGVDVCTDEAGVPTWVLAPLLRYVHDAGQAASVIWRRSFERDVPPLRTTVHAGEDCVHLLSGLRRLDEAMEFFRLRTDDRLGHALALGVEPREWAARAGRIAMPLEERLFDLAWEWTWYARHGGAPDGRREPLEREIAIRSEAVFGQAVAPRLLEELVRCLNDEGTLRRFGFPDGPPPRRARIQSESHALSPYDLALLYLTSRHVFRRGREIVRVDPAGEAEALTTLQDGLRRKVGAMGLTIEVNPSSNLLIGHLGEIKNHPLWRLRPPGGGSDIPPLAVCVGSDDPLTFAARLPEEYQLLYDALVLAGHSEEEARPWLDGARQAGLAARFTLKPRPLIEIDDMEPRVDLSWGSTSTVDFPP